ncbi:MAG: hypothetical protein C0453_20330, partial [Comamonadaceae bacterium]|nr:hypothetical protein [Comamonadaceae bacterium]
MNSNLAITSSITRRKIVSFGAASLVSLTLALSAMTAPSAQAQASRYEIDPDHLTVAFLVDHVGYAKVLGLFRSARGSYQFDEASGTLSDVRIEVETASVFSNQRKRDE